MTRLTPAKCWPSSCVNMARRLAPLRPPRRHSPRSPTATPQVLLSDIGMPSVDGYELVRRVRELIPETDMLAMALTGLGSAHDRKRALTEGFQVCMVKPVEPENLVEAIKQLLPLRQQSSQ